MQQKLIGALKISVGILGSRGIGAVIMLFYLSHTLREGRAVLQDDDVPAFMQTHGAVRDDQHFEARHAADIKMGLLPPNHPGYEKAWVVCQIHTAKTPGQ